MYKFSKRRQKIWLKSINLYAKKHGVTAAFYKIEDEHPEFHDKSGRKTCFYVYYGGINPSFKIQRKKHTW